MKMSAAIKSKIDLVDGFVYCNENNCDESSTKTFYSKDIGIYKNVTFTNLSRTIMYSLEPYRKFHRLDGPAVIVQNRLSGQILAADWYLDGLAHRNEKDGPQNFQGIGDVVTIMKYVRCGVTHRENDLPAVTKFDICEKVIEESWYNNGYLNRINDKPSYIEYCENHIAVEAFYKEGLKHRLSGPASQKYHNGVVNVLTWFINGKIIPYGVPRLLNNKPYPDTNTKLCRADAVAASMFDREYGKYLLDLINAS